MNIGGTIIAPASKSYTNRALLLAALTPNLVTIKNPLFSEDTMAMLGCLSDLGIELAIHKDKVEVIGNITDVLDADYNLNANLSGTTIRFMAALLTLVPGTKILNGEEGLNKRPIGDLVDALKQIGAQIEYLEKVGYPPLTIAPSKITGNKITLSGKTSSQFVSALLMIAPMMNGLTITIEGELISKPYVNMTIDAMQAFGVLVENNAYKTFSVGSRQKYSTKEYIVEGDYSSASYFFAIAALTQSSITVSGLNPNSKQADFAFLAILKEMGNEIVLNDNDITVHGKGVKPLTVNMNHCPDQVQTLAVLAAFARGTTKISGIASLRVKETERVIALQQELAKMNIKTQATADTLIIEGGDPKPASIETYGDHRMAMSFAVAQTKLSGTEIKNPQVVNKTNPMFWEQLKKIGAIISY
jgi:3-phosphoshikimate 1-carboxyvinyltransferase